jgi:hypothetical protein
MIYGCADEAARKIERQSQPRPTIRSGMSFYLAMESRSNMDKHKYTTKRKHNDHHVSKEEKWGEKTNKNSPDDAEQGYVDPTAQT